MLCVINFFKCYRVDGHINSLTFAWEEGHWMVVVVRGPHCCWVCFWNDFISIGFSHILHAHRFVSYFLNFVIHSPFNAYFVCALCVFFSLFGRFGIVGCLQMLYAFRCSVPGEIFARNKGARVRSLLACNHPQTHTQTPQPPANKTRQNTIAWQTHLYACVRARLNSFQSAKKPVATQHIPHPTRDSAHTTQCQRKRERERELRQSSHHTSLAPKIDQRRNFIFFV